MASNKSKHKPLTAMQRGMSDIISYEDILVAQYMNQIEKSPPTRKPSKDVPVSPYALATQTGEMTKSKRPKSAIALHQKRKELESSRALAISQGRVPFMAWDDEGAGDIEHVPRITTKKRPTSASTTRSRSSVLSGTGSAYSRSSKSLYSQGSVAGSRVKRNKPLYKKQPKVICVRAFQNGNRDNFARVTAPDLSQLIDNCTIKLGLVSAARKLFFSDGTLITDARQIEKDADVYVSCGEAFKDPYSTLKAKEELRRSASWTLTGIVLPENKSRGKTKTSLSKRMQTLVESQKRRILVFRNGESAEGVEIVAARFDEFLDDCTYKLKLESGARCLFDWEGNEIKSFRDVPVLERILQPSTTTVLGPVWVTKGGERFSPKGAYNFLLMLISNTKERLKYSKLFKEQLEMQANHSPDVQLKEVMSMTDEEVHTEIQQVEEHMSELSSVMPTLKKQIKFLQESVESEGGMETMKYQHISEIKSDSRLLGKQGLRLKVFENGRNDGEVIVYFNLAEAEKGIQGDNSQLMHRFLDTCTSSQRVGDGTGGPAGRRIAKRVFLKDGREVTDVHNLEYDQEVWLSYGEEFKPLSVMALQLTLDKASCMSLWDELEIVQREAIMDDEKGKDRPTAWRAVTGFPPGNKRQLINLDMPGPQRLIYAKGLQKSRVDEKGCFLQYREKKNLVLYPELIVDIKKKKGAKDVWPSDAQEWVITQGGIIFSKGMPQLALAKSEHAVQVKVSDDTAAGFSVHLAKRSANDINQQWGFSPTGQIYSLAKPSLFLTYVAGYEVTMVTEKQPTPAQAPEDSQPENEEQDVGTGLASLNFLDLNGSDEKYENNEDEGDKEASAAGSQEEESTAPGLVELETEFGGKTNAVVLLPKLSGKAGLQRWAVKQEDLASIGQWKHTTVANPEWNKKALSWPVTEDGNWNTDYSWPMEGFLLPLAPPVKRPSEKKSTFPGSAVRLRVMKNGDSDQSRMAVVVGPDLTNMWHDVNDVGKNSKKKRRPGGRSPSESTAAVYQSDACHPLDCKRIELELFLDQCTQALGLPFAGRRLFDEEGREVTCISDLSRDQLVFVSCGENWIDPQMSYSEQQRRALLMNLASDIAHIRQYCALRDPTDLVLDVDGPVLPGSRVVVETCLLSSVEIEKLIKRLKDEDDDEVEDEDAISPAALLSYAVTAHERAHQRADERLKSLRWSWENDKTSKGDQELEGQDEGDFSNEIAFSNPVLQKKFARQRIKSGDTKYTVSDPSFRQRWHYSDGFIHLKKNSQFVLGLEDGLKEGTASNEVVLCKKKLEDPSQRWIVSEDGSICLRSNVQLVLTVTTPPLGNDPFSYDRALDHGYRGSAVIVATKKSCANGNCHQLWSFDRLTGFIEAFASDTTNREITSANKSNVCTYAVLGQREVYQPGYVYMPGTSREKLLCEACGRASRGKNKLQRLKESRRFACFIGTDAENSSDGKFSGCFKCLNSKVDLSTLEAESTLELWEYQLDRLRNEGNVRTITKELNVAKSVPAVRILAYKNGEGSRGQGVLVIGSSIHSLLDQATTRLGLTQAARRLYTVRGELITDIHQLVRPYNASMARSLQETEEAIPEKAEAKTKKKEAVRSIPNGDAVDYIEAENKRYYDSNDSSKELQKLDLQELEDKVDDDDVESGNDTYRLAKGRKRRSLPTVMQDPSGFPRWDTRWPIDVWISCGEPFVPLEEADKQYLLSMKHREERTWIQAYLDMEKHVLRQMQGRRKGGFSPPQSPTKDPTRKEEHKEETINELKMHLLDVKSRQKNEELALSKSAKESTQRLYSTPKTVRIKVFPNGESIDRAVVVYGASIREILDNSTSRLGLSSAARRIFKQDGQEVLELDHIRRGETFCVSCGDNFIRARERRHQMELKATWSRMARSPGGNILTQSGNVHAADEAGSNSVQLALPAPPCSPSTAFKGQQHPVGEVSVHTLQGRNRPFHRS